MSEAGGLDLDAIEALARRGEVYTDRRTLHGVTVGEVVHGFCGGYFGRDSYGCRRVEAVGHDWILTRKIDPDSAPQVEMVAGPDAVGVAGEMSGAFAFLYCDHERDDAEVSR